MQTLVAVKFTHLKYIETMKRLTLLITFFLLTSNQIFAQENKNQDTNGLKLITVYDKDCPYCYDLMNKTYQDTQVKAELAKVQHVFLEVSTPEAQKFMKTFGVTAVPTQVLAKVEGITVNKVKIEGLLDVPTQLSFFKSATKTLTTTNKMASENDDFLEKKFISYICTKVDIAKGSRDDPYQKMIDILEIVTTRLKMNIKKEDLAKYAFDHIDKLVCKNTDSIKVRKYNTILKHALDSKNYRFLRSAIFTTVDGKKICNPLIDFTRVEIIDGEQESLLDFFDKVLHHPDSSAVQDLDTVRDIKNKLERCVELYKKRNV